MSIIMHDHMIVLYLHLLARKPHDTFDKIDGRVIRIPEDYDFAALRNTDLISQLIYQKIIAVPECRNHAVPAHEKRLHQEAANHKHRTDRDCRDFDDFENRDKELLHAVSMSAVRSIKCRTSENLSVL